jgi:hypothetical protein
MPGKLWLLAIAAALAASPGVAQQQRSPPVGSATLNRAWPWSGRWEVLLLKHLESTELQCNVPPDFSRSTIQLATEASNYAQSLYGVKKAMEYYDECRGQADRLNALQKSAN